MKTLIILLLVAVSLIFPAAVNAQDQPRPREGSDCMHVCMAYGCPPPPVCGVRVVLPVVRQ